MPAEVILKPRKEFEIILRDESGSVTETIKGKFGTWALKRFCDKRNLPLGSEAVASLRTVGGLVDYLLHAVEQVARKAGEPFSYTDIHASDWIDEMGGIDSVPFTKLIKHSESEQDGQEAGEEKKTDN